MLRRFAEFSLPPLRQANTEWKILQLLSELGVPAPLPLVNDGAGTLCGSPAIVVSYLPGRPVLAPKDTKRWALQLAAALVRLHVASRGLERPSFLPHVSDKDRAWVMSDSPPPDRISRHPDGPRVVAALREQAKALDPAPECIVHADYWAGNTVWNRGRITGIIDWTWACWGNPAYDVAYGCFDMWLTGRDHEAAVFLEEYERLTGAPVQNLRYYALLCCNRPMPDPAIWLPSWHDFGMTEVTADDVRRGLSRSIRRAFALPA
jgi:aminoglycoside phosphotransferase (APT) family kinase protein